MISLAQLGSSNGSRENCKFVKLIWIKKVVEIKNLKKSFLIFDVCDQFDIRCPLIGELK